MGHERMLLCYSWRWHVQQSIRFHCHMFLTIVVKILGHFSVDLTLKAAMTMY
jgi:hypothetical protein